MPAQQTKSDLAIDFIVYTAIAYLGFSDRNWDFPKRLLISLSIGLGATLLRILLNPLVTALKVKLKKRKVDKNTFNPD